MTVKELIEQLQPLPEDLPVYVCDTVWNEPYPIDWVDKTISDRIDINFEGPRGV